MRRDILDLLPVDPDLAAVAQRLEIFVACEGAVATFQCIFRSFGHAVILLGFGDLLPSKISQERCSCNHHFDETDNHRRWRAVEETLFDFARHTVRVAFDLLHWTDATRRPPINCERAI